jgi:hypothetical protein
MTMEPTKTFELGVYTFGNTPRTADGGYGPTAQAIRDALVPGRTASWARGRSPASPGTPPPSSRNSSTVCSGRTTSASPIISRVGTRNPAACPHEVVDQFGAIEGQLERNRAAHAVSHAVRAGDAERLEQRCRVAGHALVAERSSDVAGATMALQIDELGVASKHGQQAGETALDGAERAVEQRERRAVATVAVAPVVHLERAHVDVARVLRRRRDRLAGVAPHVNP